jgi:hypothetical protein
MGRTACTEPQCLYKGALYLYLLPCYKRGEKSNAATRDSCFGQDLYVAASVNPLNPELNPIC